MAIDDDDDDTVSDLEAARIRKRVEQVLNTPEGQDRAARIFQAVEMTRHIQYLSNETLAHELLEKVWTKLDMFSEESSLVSEAICRLAPDDKEPT